MSEERVIEILQSCEAMLEGHFRYTSGRHGNQYFEKIKIIRYPAMVDELGLMMASKIGSVQDEFDVVCAPAFGAIVFGYSAAFHLGKPFAFLQRDKNGIMTVRGGFKDAVTDKRILLIEDVATTGGSIRESVKLLSEYGSEVVQIGIIVDRTGGTLDFGIPYNALLTVEAESWEKESCPLCKRGIPISIPGSSNKR